MNMKNISDDFNPKSKVAAITPFGIQSVSCRKREPLSPLYLSVRRDRFLHFNIGNPDDPYDYNAIASLIKVYANDVNPPLCAVFPQVVPQTVPVYPCGPGSDAVNGIAEIIGVTVVAGGLFTPILYSHPVGIFTTGELMFGLNQTADYISPNDTIPTPDEFDIDIDLQDGPIPTDSSQAQYIGFTYMDFAPDNPNEPNGNGTYFFVVNALARVKYKSEPS